MMLATARRGGGRGGREWWLQQRGAGWFGCLLIPRRMASTAQSGLAWIWELEAGRIFDRRGVKDTRGASCRSKCDDQDRPQNIPTFRLARTASTGKSLFSLKGGPLLQHRKDDGWKFPNPSIAELLFPSDHYAEPALGSLLYGEDRYLENPPRSDDGSTFPTYANTSLRAISSNRRAINAECLTALIYHAFALPSIIYRRYADKKMGSKIEVSPRPGQPCRKGMRVPPP